MKTNIFYKTLLSLLIVMVFSLQGNATKHYVTNTSDALPESLRAEITSPSTLSGDTIIIDVSGTLVLNSSIAINKSIKIFGPGPIHFNIDGDNLTSAGITISGGADVVISGIEFENFNSNAIKITNSFSGVLLIKECLFENNSDAPVLNYSGSTSDTVKILGCSFFNNTSNTSGVAIYQNNGFSEIINCTFHNNNFTSAGNGGGALYLNGTGNSTIRHCTIYNNNQGPSFANVNAKAIYSSSGTQLTIRNSIIFNDVNTTALMSLSGTVDGDGGNVVPIILSGSTTFPTSSFTNSYFSTPIPSIINYTHVTDGWGMKYFTPTSDGLGINIGGVPDPNILYDQRRVWRTMDNDTYSSGGELSDAGAVEYTPLTVNSNGGSMGSMDAAMLDYTNLEGNTAFVFEFLPADLKEISLFSGSVILGENNTIINGFSQNGSRVPGPGTNATNVTPAITPVFMNGQSSSNAGIAVTGSNVVVAGLSIQNYAPGMRLSSFNTEVSGCHIGVDTLGINNEFNAFGYNYPTSNTTSGIFIDVNATTKIGAGNYCGNVYHNNRNVISNNGSYQIKSISPNRQLISSNFIGLSSDGKNKPTVLPVPNAIGIEIAPAATNVGTIVGGSFREDYNVISGDSIGILIHSSQNLIFNNIIGAEFNGLGATVETENQTGIIISGGQAFDNVIGDNLMGNVIGGNTTGIKIGDAAQRNKVFNNYIGLGADGSVNLANATFGIDLFNNSKNIIGGVGKGNFITNNGKGIRLAQVDTTTIQGNYIGFLGSDSTGASTGLSSYGIFLEDNSQNVKIGGCDAGEGNYIGNCTTGIGLEGSGGSAANDSILGNFIGLDRTGGDAGNIEYGIYIYNGFKGGIIGDDVTGCGNQIAYNGTSSSGGGVVTESTSSPPNANILLSGNSFHDNDSLAFDLAVVSASGGPLVNGYGYANAPQNDNAISPCFQILTATKCGDGTTNITFVSDISLSTDIRVEVFKTHDNQEPEEFIGQYDLSGVAAGVTQVINLGNLLLDGDSILASYSYMNSGIYTQTSEFSGVAYVDSIVALDAGADQSICEGTVNIVLSSVTTPSGTAVWFENTISNATRIGVGQTITLNTSSFSANTYTYFLVDSVGGCYGVSDTMILTVNPAPTVTAVATDITCFGVSDGTITFTSPTVTPSYSYSIDGGNNWQTTSSITSLSVGSYDALMKDGNGCQSSTTNLSISEPSQISFTTVLSPDTCGQGVGQIDVFNVSGGSGTYTYSFDGGANYSSNNTGNMLGAGNYDVFVANATNLNCSVSESVTISDFTGVIPQIQETEDTLYFCQGDVIVDTIFAISPTANVGTMNWYFNNAPISSNLVDSIVINNSNVDSGWLTVTETVSACTSDPDSLFLNYIQSDLLIDSDQQTTYCPGVSVDLEVSGTNVSWLPDAAIADATSDNTLAFPVGDSSRYYATQNINGCVFMDSVLVLLSDNCDAIDNENNAFSPNGDGINEMFIIDLPLMLSNDNKVYIYNRWGDQIRAFENYDNINIVWDGKNIDGELLPLGTYFYIVEIPTKGYKKSGWVQLVK